MASEMTTTNNSSKRRKTEDSVDTSLSDLPIGILDHTASFLAPISRALFAVALTNDENNNPPSENYSSIAGSDWDTLDFGEIEKDLAARLSDDDISDVLQHIDAVNKLKRLRLSNCTNIAGVGLEPLRGSTIIEQTDLSLVADGKNPWLNHPETPISCDAVLPILHSIINASLIEGCALKHLEFPYKWRRDRSADSVFHAFIVRYNQLWESRNAIRCFSCNEDLPTDDIEWIDTHTRSRDCYGTHAMSCYQCTKHYCYYCSDEDGNRNFSYCDQCQRDYCKNCVKVGMCDNCEQFLCEHCSNYKECDKCNDKMCLGCIDEPHVCAYCDVAYCQDCNNGLLDSEEKVSRCEKCNKCCCNSCRLRMCKEGGSEHCIGCIKIHMKMKIAANEEKADMKIKKCGRDTVRSAVLISLLLVGLVSFLVSDFLSGWEVTTSVWDYLSDLWQKQIIVTEEAQNEL